METIRPTATLDHVVINARDDLDAAAAIYRRLGFTLTERGYHSFGSMNHLAIFGADYLELIGLPRGGATTRRDLLEYPAGLNGLVFGSEDAAATYAVLQASGAPFDPPVEFSRPVKLQGGPQEVRFRGIFMKPGVVPYGRVYFCHHLTRQLVWRDEWRHHDNGVVAVQRMVIVDPDPEAASRLYATTFGAESVRESEGGRKVIVGNSRVDIVTETSLRASFGNASADPRGRSAYMAALTFRTVSLSKAKRVLGRNGMTELIEDKRRLVVPAHLALGVTLEFIE